MFYRELKATYKDANRNWWTITTCVDRTDSSHDNHDDPDHIWSYELTRLDGDITFKGEVFCQYRQDPDIKDILKDVLNSMNSTMLGMAKHAKLEVEND